MRCRVAAARTAKRIFKQRVSVDRELQTIAALIGINTVTQIADLDRVVAGIGIGAVLPAEIDALFHRANHGGDVFGPTKQHGFAFATRDFLRRAVHQPLRRVAPGRRIEGPPRFCMQAPRQRTGRIAEYPFGQPALIAGGVRCGPHHRDRIQRRNQLLSRTALRNRG